MLKVTNRDIVTAALPPTEALKQLQDMKGLSVKVSYAIGRTLKVIRAALDDYETERKKRLAQYTVEGVLDQDAYTVDMEELLAIEVDLHAERISLSSLMNAAEALTPGAMADLDWLIRE